ncbi:MAG TPA: POT family MFS transporter [Sedimentisphaerales bacterium]|nr:POT family MFS transporter [Sedimentisphaerales bacterium]
MTSGKHLNAPLPTTKMPPAVPYILANEATERFAFYGSRAILVFFMTHLLRSATGELAPMADEQARFWFHLFISAVYFTPLIGALISDIWLGKYRTILLFSIVYAVGFLALTVDQSRIGLFAALILIAIGSGIIKPCVSAFVGDQFGTTNKHLMPRVYSWFYWSINLGSFVATLAVPELLDRYGPRVAFGVPLGFMILAIVAFWMGRRQFVHIPRAGAGFVAECFSGEGLRAIVKLSIIYLFTAPFWSLFDQMDSSWMLQATRMDRHWLGHEWLPTQIVAANPLLILILIPVFSYGIYPAMNRVFPLTALRKIGMGLFVAAGAFTVSALIEKEIVAGGAPSVGWLVLAYVFLTSAEVMVSITALEFSYTQAPKRMKSFIMAIFLLSISLGNVFTAVVNAVIMEPDGTSKLAGASYYWFFVGVMVATAILFIPVARRYPVKDYIQDEAPAQ